MITTNNLMWDICTKKGLGVEKNYEQALKWYSMSAERNNPIAQENNKRLLEEINHPKVEQPKENKLEEDIQIISKEQNITEKKN